MSVKVGDTFGMVYTIGGRTRSVEEVTVTKVGRKYFYVDGGGREGDNKFNIDTLCQETDYNITRILYPSVEAYEEECAMEKLKSDIQFYIRDTRLRYMDCDQLKAIADIIRG